MIENKVNFLSTRQQTTELIGIIHEPLGSEQKTAAVLCHPDPMDGGSMDVSLITKIANRLCTQGIVALRFDFGGVGLSGGVFTNGKEEPKDVEAAAAFMSNYPNVNPERVCLIGWSFGARMALASLAMGIPVYACISIALPLDEFEWEGLAAEISANSKTKRFYFVGARDQYCKVDTLMSFTSKVSADDKKNVNVLYGTDHFFPGREEEVANLAVERIVTLE
ncbi:MAG: prolyl oligopeptidase family serine peptidase [Actinobacteria bacterium]|nr:prolyl oligopeptidase family serine peptidase [Actinomycetota bacterium]